MTEKKENRCQEERLKAVYSKWTWLKSSMSKQQHWTQHKVKLGSHLCQQQGEGLDVVTSAML